MKLFVEIEINTKFSCMMIERMLDAYCPLFMEFVNLGRSIIMKIVHILNTDSYSGAENVAIQIIDYINNGLKSMNDVSKGCGFEAIYMSKNGSIKDVLVEREIPFYAVEQINRESIKRMLEELQPDILHCHDYTTSILAAYCTRKKVISHLHNNSPWIKKHGLYSWIYLISCFRYSKILLVSDAIRDEYVFAGFVKKKMKVIGNPINLSQILLQSKAFIVSKEYDICFLGRLSKPKNPFLFLEVIAEIKKRVSDIKVCMIGTGELREKVEQWIIRNDLEDNVDLLGFIRNPYPYLKKSRFLLGTSIWEGYGLFAIEAIALGKPVVCTKVGGLTSIVTEDCGYLCIDKQELVDSSLKLLQDKDEYDRKVKGTIKRINKLYDLNGYMEQIIRAYES